MRGLAAAALVLLLLPGGVLAGSAPAPRRVNLQSEKERLQQTQKRLREQREKAEQARRRESSVLAELEQVSRRLADKQREVARLDGRIRRAHAEVTGLRADVRRLEGRRAVQEEGLARRLRALYRVHAQGGALPVILSGEDPMARAVAVRQLASLAVLDARLIREYRETSDELRDRQGRSETRERELEELRVTAQRERADVDRDAATRRALLARVRDERVYHERMVGELTEATRRLEAFIQELQARRERELRARREQQAREARERAAREGATARAPGGDRQVTALPAPRAPVPPGPGPSGVRGRLPWPTDGRVVAAFGPQVHPRFGTRTYRNGVDIEAAEGHEVTAVLAGQVVYSGWFRGYGNLIIVDHGHELYTLYAHVADIAVKDGDEVRQGQRIGAVGDTGSLAGPRLYFEVRYQGRAQDPEHWLRQRG